MQTEQCGTILAGDEDRIRQSYEKWTRQSVDQDLTAEEAVAAGKWETTLGKRVSVVGSGTFLGRAQRKMTLEPSEREGWRFDRVDLPASMPIHVSVGNVWTTVRNIVLCSGSPHNYMRMAEHIIALRVGMGLDNVVIRMDSGDPPLFDRSSMDLVEAVEEAGIVSQQKAAVYVTVKEPVTVGGPNGGFLTLLPAEAGSRDLVVDCAVDFRSAIGKQRIRFNVNRKTFRIGAFARTNTTLWKMLYCRTIGKIFADTRNLGYTTRNILVAGPRRYFNKPRLVYGGKSLEAVWHRATLDLLAAVALTDRGRFAGSMISYKSGHTLDAQMIGALHKRGLFEGI